MKLTKATLVQIILYFFSLTFIFIWFFSDYNYFNIYILSFMGSFYIFGTIIIVLFNKESLLSIEVIFNIFGLLYSNYYIGELIQLNMKIDSTYGNIMLLAHFSMIVFNVTFFFANYLVGKVERDSNIAYDSYKIKCFFIFLFIISIMAEVYVVFYRIGYSNFFHATRASKSLMMEDFGILSFYKSTIPMVSAVSLYLYLKYKEKGCMFLTILAFVISFGNAIISGSRAELISIFLPVLFLLYYFERISNKMVMFLGVLFFLFFGAWKSMFWGEINISFDSEFDSWYRIGRNVFSDESFRFIYGNSYFKTLINLIIPITNMESLSTWYVKTYESSVYRIGGGRGFSGIIEAYMNFGVLGNILVFAFYGWLAKKLKGNNDRQILVYAIIMISVYQIFRSDSYSLWKNLMWFKIYPVLLIFWLSRRNVKKESI